LLYLYGCADRPGRFITADELMGMHGFQQNLQSNGLTDAEATRIVGNITCSTTLAVSFTPILRALGILKRSERPEQ
jgi:hypothetical protein